MKLLAQGGVRAIAELLQPRREAAINPRGDLLVAQALPPLAELVRMRRSYWAIGVTPQTTTIGIPTTSAQLTVHNNNPATGASFVIDSVFAIVTANGSAHGPFGMWGMTNVGVKSAPAAGLVTPRGLAGQAYSGNALVAEALTVTADTWVILGNSLVEPGTATLGMAVDCNIGGAVIVPPGHMFSVTSFSNTAAAVQTALCGIRWHEVQLAWTP